MKQIIPGIVANVEADRPLGDLALAINARHQDVEASLQAGLAHALEAGALLNAAKRKVGRGNWLPWLKGNVTFSERTAQGYMRLDRERDRLTGNPQRVADLSCREALALLTEKAEEPAQREEPAPQEEPSEAGWRPELLDADTRAAVEGLAGQLREREAELAQGLRAIAGNLGVIWGKLTGEQFTLWCQSRGMHVGVALKMMGAEEMANPLALLEDDAVVAVLMGSLTSQDAA